ncbi:MAG: helix-turn-helix domain-containing protein [Frankia sp.]|nr:helix-turn-helix domain-containing protein [Frankia sp.]
MNAGNDAKGLLAARVKSLARDRGMTVVQLAEAASYTRRYMTTVLSGRTVPSSKVVTTLDKVLRANGELVALRERAAREQLARRHGLPLPEDAGSGSGRPLVSQTVRAEVGLWGGDLMSVDRRTVLGGGALAAALAAAADTSRAMATADPDPLTIDELEQEVAAISGRMFAVPHAVLFASTLQRWATVDQMLASRLTLATRARLTLAAGYLASYTASLGGFLGQPQVKRRFLVLARQYADDTGDPLLIGTVAGAQSRAALALGQFARAADVAGAAIPTAHPYVKARLAGYQAEALAAAGHPDRATDALATMRASMPNLPLMPGTSRWDAGEEATYAAMTCYRMGDAPGAIRNGLEALDAIDGDDFQGVGLAHISIAFGRILADRPDPAAAAVEGGHVLDIMQVTPDASLLARAEELREALRPWNPVPEVATYVSRLERLIAAEV